MKSIAPIPFLRIEDYDPNNPFEPGKYDSDKGFGANAVVHKIPPYKSQKPKPPPPDDVDTAKALNATRCRSPSYQFSPEKQLPQWPPKKTRNKRQVVMKKNIEFANKGITINRMETIEPDASEYCTNR